MSQNIYIIGSKRVPFTKSMGFYRGISTQKLMEASMQALTNTYNLGNRPLGEVALGAVINSSRNWNLAREVVLGSGLHPDTPAYNLQRACGTSLEAASQLALKISAHQIEDGIAAGVDTNSDAPIEVGLELRDFFLDLSLAKTLSARLKLLTKLGPSLLKIKTPAVVEPRTKKSMGEHCELMVREWQISQSEQDALAYKSHQNAVKSYNEGFYQDLVIPFHGLQKDSTPRADTTLEKLAKLRPAFAKDGTITAGNASPLTDGSAAVLLAGEKSLKENGWTPLARFVDAQSAAVDFVHGAGLLMAPTVAVSKLLERNHLQLQDFDYYEIHEAFAGQVLCTLKAWQSEKYCREVLKRDRPMGSIDLKKMNVVGGSVALGHPFAATGARILGTLAKLLAGKTKQRGLISICTAGGMGVAAIIEGV